MENTRAIAIVRARFPDAQVRYQATSLGYGVIVGGDLGRTLGTHHTERGAWLAAARAARRDSDRPLTVSRAREAVRARHPDARASRYAPGPAGGSPVAWYIWAPAAPGEVTDPSWPTAPTEGVAWKVAADAVLDDEGPVGPGVGRAELEGR